MGFTHVSVHGVWTFALVFYFARSVLGFSVFGVFGDLVSFAPFADGCGCFSEGFGYFVCGGVVGQFYMVWVLWVDAVAEFCFEFLEF